MDELTCISTGQLVGGPTGSGRILVSHDGGRSWAGDQVMAASPLCHRVSASPCPRALQPWFQLVTAQIGFGGLASIACAARVRYSCATVWSFWSVIADTTDGAHWHVGTLTAAPDDLGNGNYSSISPALSCPAAGRCFAVEAPLVVCGHDVACTHTAILESIPHADTGLIDDPLGDGWEWGLAGYGPPGAQQPALEAISCASVTTCVAVGKWQPNAPQGWGESFPLVIAPQSPLEPYFVPTTNAAWTLLATMAPVALGVGALILSAGGAAPLVVVLLASTSTLSGAVQCSQGNTWGCVSAALGAGGLVLGSLGMLGSALAPAGDMTLAGQPELLDPPGDFLPTGGDNSLIHPDWTPPGAADPAFVLSADPPADPGMVILHPPPGPGDGLAQADLAASAAGDLIGSASPTSPAGPGNTPPPSWLETPQEPDAGPADE